MRKPRHSGLTRGFGAWKVGLCLLWGGLALPLGTARLFHDKNGQAASTGVEARHVRRARFLSPARARWTQAWAHRYYSAVQKLGFQRQSKLKRCSCLNSLIPSAHSLDFLLCEHLHKNIILSGMLFSENLSRGSPDKISRSIALVKLSLRGTSLRCIIRHGHFISTVRGRTTL